MKKILVTGGSGFIGTNFINLISNLNYEILNIDKISKVSTPEKFKLIKNKKKYYFTKNNLRDHKNILNIRQAQAWVLVARSITYRSQS